MEMHPDIVGLSHSTNIRRPLVSLEQYTVYFASDKYYVFHSYISIQTVVMSSVPSRRRISGSAEFWPTTENVPKKIRPP